MEEFRQDNAAETQVSDPAKKAADRKRLAENLRRSIEAHKNRLAMARKSKQEQPRLVTGSRTPLKKKYARDVEASGHHAAFAQIHEPVSIKHTQSSLNKINVAASRPYYNPNCRVHGIHNNGIASLNEPSPVNIQFVTPNFPGNPAGFVNNTVQYCSAKVSVNSPASDAVVGTTTLSDNKNEVLNNAELCKKSNDVKDISSDDLRKLIVESGISEAKILELLRKIVIEILTGAQPVSRASIENDPDVKTLLSYRFGDNNVQESSGKQDKLMNLLLNCISTSIAASTKEDVLSSSRSNKSVNVEINLNMQNPDTECTIESSRPLENNEPVMIESVFNKNSEGVLELEEQVSFLDRLRTWTPNLGFLKCKTDVCGDCTNTDVEINSFGTKGNNDFGLATQGTNASVLGREGSLRAHSINSDPLKAQASRGLTSSLSKTVFRPRYQTRTSIAPGDNAYVKTDSRNASINSTGDVGYPASNTLLPNAGSNNAVPAAEHTPSGAKYLIKAKTYGGRPTVSANNSGYFASPKAVPVQTSNITPSVKSSGFNENFRFVQPRFVPVKMGTTPLNAQVPQRMIAGSTPSWTPKATFVPVTHTFNIPRPIYPLNTGIPGHVQDVFGGRGTPVSRHCAIHGSPIAVSNNWNQNSLVSSKRVVETLNTLGRLNQIY